MAASGRKYAVDPPAEGARMDIVFKAREFSAAKHAQQTRKYTGEPYFVHLEAVANLLERNGIVDREIIAAAYLHDTVEDTETTIQELMEEFGENVAELVYWLTDDEKGRRKARKIMSAWRLGRAPWEAKLVKLADLIDNTLTICSHDRHFAPVYLREKRAILDSMARHEGERLTSLPLYKEAARILALAD
jgi:GTP diphosphokinase / guanosine-3',5'-bis(diphosphate) 3'-diphosphatase